MNSIFAEGVDIWEMNDGPFMFNSGYNLFRKDDSLSDYSNCSWTMPASSSTSPEEDSVELGPPTFLQEDDENISFALSLLAQQLIMDETKTDIKYPKFMKVGAKNKKDPHVRVVGEPEAVRIAGAMVRHELEPHSKVTMKLDVSWVHHSHLIGKGGNTIQPIVKRTGVSIHFPDGNKNSEVRKSNLVSINGRGDDLSGLEEARACIRNLTPLVFTFSLSASAQFINISDPSLLIQQLQNTYNVQVDLKVTDDLTPMIVGSVRGDELDAVRVKEATLCILQAYCDTLAKQMPVQMSLEISPQHHTFVLGRNNETLKRIMQRTATKITFPDTSDMNVHPLRKSTVVISGAIDNVYLARQNILGALPLVLMFELMPEQEVDAGDIPRIMQNYDVNINIKNKRLDGRRLVVIKGAEKNADSIYEAWRIVAKAEKEPPKARIPANYHISEAAPLYGLSMTLADLNLGHWLGGSGNSSPTSTPAPPQLHSSSHWGVVPPPSSSQVPSPLPRSQYNSLALDPNTPYYTNNYLRNGALDGYNNNCILSKSSGKGSFSTGMNLNSFITGMTLSSSDVSCGTSSNSGSSMSSPAPSPRDPSPDQIMGSQSALQYGELDSTSKMGIKALSVMMTDIERRAPGCEKKRLELEHQKLTSLSDYNSKKLQAAKAMKEQVNTNPRTPTSSWSGYGFSKSMPGFMIRQKMQESRLQKSSHKGELESWDAWQSTEGEKSDFTSCQGLSNIPYSSHLTQISANLGNSDGSLALQRPLVSLSASNFIDCVLPRPCKTTGSPSQRDITSILTDIQLEQYIDVFAAQEVDLDMFLTLNDTDLKELGIKIFGHRKRILMVIKDLASKKPFYGVNMTPAMDHPAVLREGSSSTWD
ncbi:protein bicaudal C homolog 1-like isoform X3 [Macrobrachium rosenbergii]|uniref:protein bicaudal C homolog 1-like isoform X3 n=1 Tax=Macrobrachium rosenbergii TaxID=79674 RepID=UPI0034D40EE0